MEDGYQGWGGQGRSTRKVIVDRRSESWRLGHTGVTVVRIHAWSLFVTFLVLGIEFRALNLNMQSPTSEPTPGLLGTSKQPEERIFKCFTTKNQWPFEVMDVIIILI